MNWQDYARGYEEGREDTYNSGNNNNLFITLVRFAFCMLLLAVRLCFGVIAGLLALLWAIIKAIVVRRR